MEPPDRLDQLLAPLRADPASAGIFADFDGTLARIVDDPPAARPLEGAVEVLAGLARRYRTVAIVSGRPAAFLATHLGGRGLVVSGLYGLERADDGDVRTAREAEPWRHAVDEAVTRAEAEFGSGPGGGVERKGLSVTVHYRNDPERRDRVEAWARQEATRSGLVAHPARMSVELRPPVARDKGTVVSELGAGLRAACFLGDDRGDLKAFDALDGLAAQGAAVLRVAVRSTEAPPELLGRADVMVDGPEGALDVLRRL